MKFALIDNIKTKATKGARGICPNCGSELIAKCGEIKVNHWAHKRIRNCDHWWEKETPWHRSWKNKFPDDWQEISLIDEETGEKHIADVRTNHGLVIEFQHSHIDPQERTSREIFYKNLVWVVDGTRLKGDWRLFLKGLYNFRDTNMKEIFSVDSPEKYFPPNWLRSSVPVVFDFRNSNSKDDFEDERNQLYCIFPKRVGSSVILAKISRKAFTKAIINGEWTMRSRDFVNKINQAEQRRQNKIAKEEKLLKLIKSKIATKRPIRYRKRRRRL